MKKLSIILLAALLLSAVLLTSCSNYYDEVKPTDKEDETLVKTSAGDIKFDLFAAYYLTNIDLGYSEKDALTRALSSCADIYAVFALCREAGIDPESKDVLNKVDDTIVASVEGGTVDGIKYQGYGDFDKYLAALREVHLTDRANRLIIRSYLCKNLLIEHYLDKSNIVDENAVREYFLSDDCIRISQLMTEYETNAYAAYEKIQGKSTRDEILSVFIQYTPTASVTQYENGWYMGRYEAGESYAEIAKAAFALSDDTYTEVLEDTEGMYYIVYKLPKDNAYIDTHYGEIRESYIYNSTNKRLLDIREQLLKDADYTDRYTYYSDNLSAVTL